MNHNSCLMVPEVSPTNAHQSLCFAKTLARNKLKWNLTFHPLNGTSGRAPKSMNDMFAVLLFLIYNKVEIVNES